MEMNKMLIRVPIFMTVSGLRSNTIDSSEISGNTVLMDLLTKIFSQ